MRVQGDLLEAHAIGVRNVFVVMGDPTSICDYPNAMDNYDLVPTGLIKLIKQGFNLGIDHSGIDIGQPTTFFTGCACNLNPPDLEKELRTLKKKLDAGADFILTQPIYDPKFLDDFLMSYEKNYGVLKIPLLIGILPLANSRHASFLHHEVPGISISEEILSRIQNSVDNSQRVGIKITIELIEKIKSKIQGIYVMPSFNHYHNVYQIIEEVKK